MSEASEFFSGAVIEQRQTYDRPLTVELTRGAKGVYRWSIRYHAHDANEALEQLTGVDWALFQHFVVLPREVTGEDKANTA